MVKDPYLGAINIRQISRIIEYECVVDVFHCSKTNVLIQWYVQAACATQGTGLYEGLDWLSSELSKQVSFQLQKLYISSHTKTTQPNILCILLRGLFGSDFSSTLDHLYFRIGLLLVFYCNIGSVQLIFQSYIHLKIQICKQ